VTGSSVATAINGIDLHVRTQEDESLEEVSAEPGRLMTVADVEVHRNIRFPQGILCPENPSAKSS
jgi:hypothetical protein